MTAAHSLPEPWVARNAAVLQRACACGGSEGEKCPECAAKERLGIQPRLTLSAPGDPYEREADRVADRVAAGGPAGAVTPLLQRETVEDEDETLQRKAAAPGPARTGTAAAAVARGGRPLTAGERGYFEPRFGRDLSAVRIHERVAAARDIQARAYTLGHHIAFAPGQYDAASAAGRRLMAHELTHTLQQSGTAAIQRVCTPVSVCAGPVAGSAEEFGRREETREATARSRRQRMRPARARASGHAGRAAQLERFFAAEDPGWLTFVHGIFIDADMSSGTGAITMSCADFLADSLPAGDPDPDGFAGATRACVFVPGALNREAFQFNRGARRIAGQSREDWRNETRALLLHEVAHEFYDVHIEPQLPRPSGVTTATCTDARVEPELSEILSIISEFPVFFAGAEGETNPRGPAHARLGQYFDDAVRNPSESFTGALTRMGCNCNCDEVDRYVTDRVDIITAGWSDPEKSAFRAGIQARMPAPRRPSWPNAPTP